MLHHNLKYKITNAFNTSSTAETLEIADLGFTALADKIHDRIALSGVDRFAADLFYSAHAASPPMNGIAP